MAKQVIYLIVPWYIFLYYKVIFSWSWVTLLYDTQPSEVKKFLEEGLLDLGLKGGPYSFCS